MIINNQSQPVEKTVKTSQTVVNADGSVETFDSLVVREHFMELIINERLVAKLVCTPADLVELVLGRMVSESFIKSAEDVESIYICDSGNKAKVFLKNTVNLQPVIENEPTCCTGNQVMMKMDTNSDMTRLVCAEWKTEWIFALAEEFAKGSRIHKQTKGTHCCYLGVAGKAVYMAEDIGRHNAMDKAIGYAVQNGIDLSKCILYTTGRVPTDMVKKAVASKVPILVSKAVPTNEAIIMAKKYNLTLICKAWPDRFEIFNAAEQI